MKLSNTAVEYGVLARFFHWGIAVMILGLLPVGLFMTEMENSPQKFEIYALHKSFGLAVFFLGLARIAWRFVSPPPHHLPTHAKWEVTLASAAHFWLYVCVIGMPLTGWLMSSAMEFPVPFFGLHMPWLMAKDEIMGARFALAHEVLAYTLLFILALHIAGALKHHVIDRDETLARMMFKGRGFLAPVLVVIVAGFSFAVCAFYVLKDFQKESEQEAPPVVGSQLIPSPALPDTSNLPEKGWVIVPAKSTLQFTASMYETPFTGTLKNFSGDIIFNPDDLPNAKADIRIGIKDVSTGDADRDSSITGLDWFDSENYPEAIFKTIKFEKGENDDYVAIGNLTIRGVTLPISLPFTLDIDGDTAHMKGTARLNRLDFGMGKGSWEDPKTVGHDVDVIVDITVIR